ncbi:hypothetical protein HG536_0C00900 [Torulaspora globosa]|uniref:Uncharacterized protein n=1 Tax=Torulaspora globosa TaxID=48254 RepID=A0A7G3ZEI7_9SACH|nr:uncharacterized protein HG536_0C00900 [Torulaspora globosa]QLL31923.1 hypothetical protein HG536_0C00900 [Torulaspora globosa]
MSVSLGAAVYIALKPILKIYTIMAVGYLLVRFDIVSMETSRGISNMVVNAILPCLTFNKIVSGISDKDIKQIGVIVLSAVLLFTVGGSCALLTKLITPAPKKWFWGLLFGGIFPNISDLPIAYVQSMGNGSIFTSAEAEKGVAYCCIFLISQSFLMMNFGLWRLVGLDFRDRDTADNEREDTGLSRKSSLRKDDLGSEHQAQDENLAAENQRSYELQSFSSNAIESDNEDLTTASSRPGGRSLSRSRASSVKSLGGSPRECPDTDLEAQTRSAGPSAREHSRLKRYYSTDIVSLPQKPSRHNSRRSSLRKRGPSISDVVLEYSVADQIRDGEIDLSRPLTLTEDLGYRNSTFRTMAQENGSDSNTSIEEDHEYTVTRTQTSAGRIGRFLKRHKMGWIEYAVINFFRPASLGALLGIIVAMIPWLKALFVPTDVHVHNAPDGLPVLNFLMDFTSYIGNACVPLGLLLLGGTIARLEIGKLPKKFVRVAVLMTVLRLMVIPIIGVAWANKLYEINWLDNVIGKFIMILTWSMPSATAQVYFTAFYTPLEGSHTQLDCLSVFILMQYSILFITVPFVITYTIKVDLQL